MALLRREITVSLSSRACVCVCMCVCVCVWGRGGGSDSPHCKQELFMSYGLKNGEVCGRSCKCWLISPLGIASAPPHQPPPPPKVASLTNRLLCPTRYFISFHFYFIYFGVQLIHNVVLVLCTAVIQLYIYIYPFFFRFFSQVVYNRT